LHGKCVRNSFVAVIFALPQLHGMKMRNDKKPVPVNATDWPAQIVIIITPDIRPSRYRAHVEGDQETLCVSRQPFLDGARKLIARGHDPQTILVMRWAGAKDWTVRGPLGVAAKLTVEWKPYSRSAVPPVSVNPGRNVPKGRAAEKAIPESTAETAFGREHASAGDRDASTNLYTSEEAM
jgi:hypothetical protein